MECRDIQAHMKLQWDWPVTIEPLQNPFEPRYSIIKQGACVRPSEIEPC